MSDFLFCTARQTERRLAVMLERRVAPLAPAVSERHGAWGSLAIAQSAHDAPVASVSGPAARVIIGGAPGPFARIEIDTTGAGSVTTDLMAFIPVFWSVDGRGALVVGTHVDAVAEAAGRADTLDPVSAADFLVRGSIVFPHTLYPDVWQLAPAVERRFAAGTGWTDEGHEYWTPHERSAYDNVDDAAAELRRALSEEVARSLDGVETAGMLLSAGEDSRAVLGAVPGGVRIDAVTFADWESREVRIARRIAHAYGASFRVGLRSFTHYLDSLEPVTSLVGSQHQYFDAHAWGLHESLGLDRLPVVLGGFSADVLLKGYYSPARLRRSQPLGGHPAEHDRMRPVSGLRGLRRELDEAATDRRERRRAQLREIRPESATEWARIWPFGVRKPVAAFLGHRRLFRAHEPFMTESIVKLSASVPMEWKLSRSLFRRAMRPFLKPSRFIPHGRNAFPYFGAATSMALGAGVGIARFADDALRGRLGKHQGPWPDWSRLVDSPAFEDLLRRHPIAEARAAAIFDGRTPGEITEDVRNHWSPKQQLMFAQLAFATGADAAPPSVTP